MTTPNLIFRYRFEISNGPIIEKQFELGAQSLKLAKVANNPALPAWTRLEFEKCSNCPLKPEEHSHCPIAAQLAQTVELFKDSLSTEKARIVVSAPERYYVKDTSLQEGIFSIFGFVMATAGCPHMSIVRPLARFHLPFASLDDNVIRGVSMYLLRQYFKTLKGETPDVELKKMEEFYGEIQKVNKGFAKRLRSVIDQGDATINGLVALDSISKMVSLQMQSDFKKYAYLFEE